MNREEIDSLLQPAAYPDPTATVRFLQTHVSFIFITDRFVYKIKKPVNLGFLDFTTLQRRSFYCHEELRLNRRLAPDLYLEVVPVRATTQGASFHGAGDVVDFAVKMVRLPQELMMNLLLARGGVTAAQIVTLAGIVARFHLIAPRGPGIDRYGTPEAIRANWEENFAIVQRFAGKTVTDGDFLFIRRWVEDFLHDNDSLFRERVTAGFIREGDGDLHAGNICLTQPPVIFDCIEFNERFRCLDTTADIAFLCMDLEYHGAGRWAKLFLDEYCGVTGDTGVRALLPFYEIYRACIRGEVESIKEVQPDLSQEEREAAGESARRHFRLARGLIIREKLPLTLFITCGLSGSGKSFVASELSFQLGAELFSSDLVRKQLAGIPATRRALHIYDRSFNRRTYDKLKELATMSLMAGRSVIMDATFRDPPERRQFRDLAVAHGARFVILYISCPEKIILERLQAREERCDVISDARRDIYFSQKKEFSPPKIVPGEVMFVDTTETLLHTVDALLTSLGVLPCGHD